MQRRVHDVDFVKSATQPEHYPDDDRPEVAFAGRSNVGKSSLLNRLCGRKNLARVSRTPGRTQLINFFDVDGRWYFVDLPGYGYAKVSKSVRNEWGPMMERYVRSGRSLRAMVVLLDIRRRPNAEDLQLMASLAELDIPVIPVLTKCDKLSRNKRVKQRRLIGEVASIPDEALIECSSHTGAGLDHLWDTLELALEDDDALEPTDDTRDDASGGAEDDRAR